MASTEEKGHAKNVANAKKLFTFIDQIPNYNPSNPKLQKQSLDYILKVSDEAFTKSKKTLAPYSLAVDEREKLFEPVSKKITKLHKALKATEGATPALIEDFLTISRVIKGSSKSKPKLEDNPENDKSNHSTSQMSYDKRTSNMDLLISLLENTPNFNPNEPEFQVSYLQNEKNAMLVSTQNVNNTFSVLNNSRSVRNDMLYLNDNNLVDTFIATKNYMLSILDSNSVQYKTINKISFRKFA